MQSLSPSKPTIHHTFCAFQNPSNNKPHDKLKGRHNKLLSSSTSSITTLFISNNDVNLADDEPLSSRFKRAVVLQRAGEHLSALKEYEMFINAAKQCDVSPTKYAEVLVNVGAIYTKIKQNDKALQYFKDAVRYRDDIGSAHVNIALLTLSEGQASMDNNVRRDALVKAKEHCLKAVSINDDVYSVNSAIKLLKDIEKLLQLWNNAQCYVCYVRQGCM